MKVLLVNPALSSKFPNGRDLVHDADLIHLPIGLLHLAAIAERRGHEVVIADMPVAEMSFETYRRILDRAAPDLVGVTTMTATFVNALECGRLAKAVGAVVAMGGPHVTFDAAGALNSGACDIVIRGEGEVGFDALLSAVDRGETFDAVPGAVFRRKAFVTMTPAPPRISDLDSLPPLHYDLLDMDRYITLQALGTHSSRGCPYSCEFCTIQGQWGRKVTYNTPAHVVNEVERLVDRYAYQGKEFIFYDDTFTVNRGHVMELCAELVARRIDVHWKAMTRVDRVDPELLDTMKRAGCFSVTYGIESTEEESLNRMGKGQHFEQVTRAIAMTKAAGLQAVGYFIIGFPWETRSDMQSVVEKMGQLQLDTYGLAMLAPYPGTPYYDARNRWHIDIPDPDWERFNHLLPVIETPQFTRRDQAEVFVDFLCRYVLNEAAL